MSRRQAEWKSRSLGARGPGLRCLERTAFEEILRRAKCRLARTPRGVDPRQVAGNLEQAQEPTMPAGDDPRALFARNRLSPQAHLGAGA